MEKLFMNFKNRMLIIVSLYVGIFLFFTCVFLIFFRSPFFISQQVLFYRGLSLLAMTFGVTAFVILFCSRTSLKEYTQSMIAALMIAASLHLAFFVVFPVTFERSISMYLLTTLENNRTTACGGLTKEQMKEGLIDMYVIEKDALQKRIGEQSIINMIKGKNDCYMVTDQAVRFLHFSTFIKALYNIK